MINQKLIMKKLEAKNREEKRLNIKAIRNKEKQREGRKILIQGEDLSSTFKNAHQEFYGQSDDSEDERVLSKIGRLQTHKYKDKDFVGYDENLNKVKKSKPFEDKISEFIAQTENPDWWRVVRDELNNQDVVLTDRQLHMLDNLRKGKSAKPLSFEYFEHDNFDSNNLLSSYMPKRRFIASKWERIKINKLVQGIKLGRIKLYEEPKDIEQFFDIWTNEIAKNEQLNKYLPPRVPPARISLPTNAASYNPPAEYLLTNDEIDQWKNTDPEDRDTSFIPQKYRYLRQVPSTPLLTQELFTRCLDLYLCPRVRRKKLMMKSSDFLPDLPNPEQLRPFPTHHNLIFTHDDLHKSGPFIGMSIHPDGNLLVVCYDLCVAIYDVRSTRCMNQKWANEGKFYGVAYSIHGVIALLVENGVELLQGSYTDEGHALIDAERPQRINPNIEFKWVHHDTSTDSSLLQTIVSVYLGLQPTSVDFHPKGDYFVTTQPNSQKKANVILVHCISKSQTQMAFQNMKASTEVIQTLFHPTQPNLIIMTKKHVFIYALNKQALTKKLLPGNQANSTMQIHPSGDHILLGSYDQKVCWFDLDMGVTPFKKMQYHEKVVKKVAFHPTYPLFASASDDGTINVFYGKISLTDLSQAPIILPLKVLKKTSKSSQKMFKDILFHPKQPWLFSADQSNTVSLWT